MSLESDYLRAIREAPFRPDLQTGVNKHLEYTITAANTNYQIAIPDSARFITLTSSGMFSYAIGEATVALKTGNGNLADPATAFGVGSRYAAGGAPVTHILPTGTGLILHLRSTTAATVVQISLA